MSFGPDHRSSPGSSTSSSRNPTTFTIPDPKSVEEHGRTYQGYREGKYYLPNDGVGAPRAREGKTYADSDTPRTSKTDWHKCWELLMKGHLFLAPIGSPKRVLDIGTGTGIWAINFAKQQPQAHVIGNDLSLIQPDHTAPQNCTFAREDAEDPWVFDEPFDFIHLRSMCTCFNDSRGVMETAFENLAPGGWVEYQDFGWEIVADPGAEEYCRASPVARFLELDVRGVWNQAGRDITVARRYKEWMREIGFTDIVEEVLLCPVNGWPLDPEDRILGQFMHVDMEKFLESSVKMLLAAGLTQEELPGFMDSVKYSMSDTNLRGYYICYVVYGRKPFGWVPPAAPSQQPDQIGASGHG